MSSRFLSSFLLNHFLKRHATFVLFSEIFNKYITASSYVVNVVYFSKIESLFFFKHVDKTIMKLKKFYYTKCLTCI